MQNDINQFLINNLFLDFGGFLFTFLAGPGRHGSKVKGLSGGAKAPGRAIGCSPRRPPLSLRAAVGYLPLSLPGR